MSAREYLGEFKEPTYPAHPLPWRARIVKQQPQALYIGTRDDRIAVVVDANGKYVAECSTIALAEFICLSAAASPRRALKLIGETP